MPKKQNKKKTPKKLNKNKNKITLFTYNYSLIFFTEIVKQIFVYIKYY